MKQSVVSTAATIACISNAGYSIEVSEQSGCGSCAQSGACGSRSRGTAQQILLRSLVEEAGFPRVGDAVSVEIPAGVLSRFAVLSYLLPAMLMCLGAALAAMLVGSSNDWPALVGSGVGLLLGWASLRLYDSRCGDSRWVGESVGTDLRIGFFQNHS